jgi:hypothetical protein
MRPFRDSTAILADTGALRARLEEDGYLFLRGLLPRAAVMTLRGQTLRAAADGGWLDPAHPVEAAIADPRAACVDPEPSYLAVLAAIYRLEALHALQHHPAIIDLFERLFGEAVLPRPRLIPRCFFPDQPGHTTAPHQDYPYVQGTEEFYTLWAPLGDCPAEMGPLQVAAASHRDGVREFRISQHPATALEVADPLDGAWVGGDFAAGDVILFHSLTVHRGSLNRSRHLRQSVDFRYQRASDPLTPAGCEPFVTSLSWEEIYRGWSSDALKYYWRRPATRVVAYDMKYFDQRDARAFALAESGDQAARFVLLRITQNDPDPAKRARAAALLARLPGADAAQ